MNETTSPAAQVSNAIRGNDLVALGELYKQYPSIFEGQSALGPLLNVAALRSSVGTVQFLLDLGLDPNVGKPPFGENALAVAARTGRLEIVKLLRSVATNLETTEPTANPLVAVSVSNSVEVAQYLLDQGIDATVSYSGKNYQGMTAASLALEAGAIEVSRKIVLHLAKDDREVAQGLLLEAYEAVKRNNPDAHSYPPPPTL